MINGVLLADSFHSLHQVSTGGSLVRSVTQTLDNSGVEEMTGTTQLMTHLIQCPAMLANLHLLLLIICYSNSLISQMWIFLIDHILGEETE